MLVIQYKLVWNGDDRVDWTDVGTVDIPLEGGAANIEMPGFGQSDRIVGGDYGADAKISCNFMGTIQRDNNNNIIIPNSSFSNFVFKYNSSIWGSHIGARVVKGTYDFFGITDTEEAVRVYLYDGPDTVVADYTVNIPGVIVSANYNTTIAPQTTSQDWLYGTCYNRVNENALAVFIRFKNDYPADYRPGAIIGSNWQSHNRSNGESHILGTNGKWIEMRTLGGGSSKGNTPSIIKDGKWVNQRKLGKE